MARVESVNGGDVNLGNAGAAVVRFGLWRDDIRLKWTVIAPSFPVSPTLRGFEVLRQIPDRERDMPARALPLFPRKPAPRRREQVRRRQAAMRLPALGHRQRFRFAHARAVSVERAEAALNGEVAGGEAVLMPV